MPTKPFEAGKPNATYTVEKWCIVGLGVNGRTWLTIEMPQLFNDKETAKHFAQLLNDERSGYSVDIARVLVPAEYIPST